MPEAPRRELRVSLDELRFRFRATEERPELRGEFTIPPDNHWDSAYDWVIERAKLDSSRAAVARL